MTDKNQDYWFYVKGFGWGWGLPSKWQGWLVYATYIALLFGGRYLFATPRYRLAFTIAITLALVGVVAWKGEKPLRW